MTVIGMIMKACAECACVQFSVVCIKKCCEGLGKIIVALSVVWSIGLLIAGIVVLTETAGVTAGGFVANFFISQGSSWVFNFVILFAKFAWYKRGENNDAEAQAEYNEYLKCRAVEVEERKKNDPNWVDDRDPNSVGLGGGQYRDGVANFVKKRMRGGRHWRRGGGGGMNSGRGGGGGGGGGGGNNDNYSATADSMNPTAVPANPGDVTVNVTAPTPAPAPAPAPAPVDPMNQLAPTDPMNQYQHHQPQHQQFQHHQPQHVQMQPPHHHPNAFVGSGGGAPMMGSTVMLVGGQAMGGQPGVYVTAPPAEAEAAVCYQRN